MIMSYTKLNDKINLFLMRSACGFLLNDIDLERHRQSPLKKRPVPFRNRPHCILGRLQNAQNGQGEERI